MEVKRIFEDTKTAFISKSNKDLRRARIIFKMVKNSQMVKLGKSLLNLALKIFFPVQWIIKPTIFKHFCGGETIKESEKTINALWEYNIGTILDYSSEGNLSEHFFNTVKNQVIETIHKANTSDKIPFSVFKITGIARFELLGKINRKQTLNAEELMEWERVNKRMLEICQTAFEKKVPVLIDAEESWIQDTIDEMADQMMQNFNKNQPIVYNTLQLYRHDKLHFLKKHLEKAKKGNYIPGYKLVRGAYLEKENFRAQKQGYSSPINPSKGDTDACYNDALKNCVENIDSLAICAGTHNEESCYLLMDLMHQNKINPGDKRVYFSQLLGMSDHISYNLAAKGYNVAKYVPYGPVKSVMPYLIRRAEENTSVAGQTSRELDLINTEIKRRKS